MVQVIKRDGRLTDFNKEKIQRAIELAMKETEKRSRYRIESTNFR